MDLTTTSGKHLLAYLTGEVVMSERLDDGWPAEWSKLIAGIEQEAALLALDGAALSIGVTIAEPSADHITRALKLIGNSIAAEALSHEHDRLRIAIQSIQGVSLTVRKDVVPMGKLKDAFVVPDGDVLIHSDGELVARSDILDLLRD